MHDRPVPVGLATQLGIAGSLILGLVAAVLGVMPNDPNPEAYAALATVLATATIVGRMLQAAAAMLGGEPWPVDAPSAVPHAAGNPGEDPAASIPDDVEEV